MKKHRKFWCFCKVFAKNRINKEFTVRNTWKISDEKNGICMSNGELRAPKALLPVRILL